MTDALLARLRDKATPEEITRAREEFQDPWVLFSDDPGELGERQCFGYPTQQDALLIARQIPHRNPSLVDNRRTK